MKLALLISLVLLSPSLLHGEVISDPERGITMEVPENWTLVAKVQFERLNRFIYDFGLPKVWSEKERQEIENAVTLAILDQPCQSLSDLVQIEDQRVQDILLEQQYLETDRSDKARKQTVAINGLKYVSRVDFLLRNGTGYVVAFTATEGTYDRNLPLYLNFLKTLKVTGRVGKVEATGTPASTPTSLEESL